MSDASAAGLGPLNLHLPWRIPQRSRGMHPRNRHRNGYDFPALIAGSPALAGFVRPTGHGGDSIDFADPVAVKALNRALLRVCYGIATWDIPDGYLCPPIPGRADYVHHVADLLAEDHGGNVPRGPTVRVLDIGVGANAIYPLLGHQEYGWSFVGSDLDPAALRNATEIGQRNPPLASSLTLRRQPSAQHIFRNVVQPGDRFDVSLCNPPFHVSAEAAASGTRRKVRNLTGRSPRAPALNFGGRHTELWCPGGELAFIRRMIAESAEFAPQFRWFTTLVSQTAHLPALHDALARVHARDVRVIEMTQGQKRSRFLAWRAIGCKL